MLGYLDIWGLSQSEMRVFVLVVVSVNFVHVQY